MIHISERVKKVFKIIGVVILVVFLYGVFRLFFPGSGMNLSVVERTSDSVSRKSSLGAPPVTMESPATNNQASRERNYSDSLNSGGNSANNEIASADKKIIFIPAFLFCFSNSSFF